MTEGKAGADGGGGPGGAARPVFWVCLAALLLPLLIVLLTLATGDNASREVVWLELTKAAIQLLLIGGLGVLLKLLLDDYVAERNRAEQRRREAEVRAEGEAKEVERRAEAVRAYRAEVTDRLLACYWGVRKALSTISAHRSAKSYGEQARVLIDHCTDLVRLRNQVSLSGGMIAGVEEITAAMTKIIAATRAVIEEWKQTYLELAQLQAEDERRPPDEKEVPGRIDRLPRLARVLARNCRMIHRAYETAFQALFIQTWKDAAGLTSEGGRPGARLPAAPSLPQEPGGPG